MHEKYTVFLKKNEHWNLSNRHFCDQAALKAPIQQHRQSPLGLRSHLREVPFQIIKEAFSPIGVLDCQTYQNRTCWKWELSPQPLPMPLTCLKLNLCLSRLLNPEGLSKISFLSWAVFTAFHPHRNSPHVACPHTAPSLLLTGSSPPPEPPHHPFAPAVATTCHPRHSHGGIEVMGDTSIMCMAEDPPRKMAAYWLLHLCLGHHLPFQRCFFPGEPF